MIDDSIIPIGPVDGDSLFPSSGLYKNRKDEMHFEVAIKPEKVEAFIKKLEQTNAN